MLSISSGTSASEVERFSISGGSIAGVYLHIAEEICGLVNQTSGDHARCASRPGFGSIFNLKALENDLIEFGLAQSDQQWNAWYGLEEWANKPATEIRAVATLHIEAVHLIGRRSSNITSVRDLKGRKVSVGNRASGQRKNALEVLDLYNLDLKKDLQAYGLLQGKALSKLSQGELDAFFYTVGYPAYSILRLAESVELEYINVYDEIILDYIGENSPYHKIQIPAHTYTHQSQPILTFGTYATLLASTHVPDKTVYELLSALYDGFEEFTASHPSLAKLRLADLSSNLTIPLHDGALEFYRDKALLEPSITSQN